MKPENEHIGDENQQVQQYLMGLMTPDEEVAFEHAVAKDPQLATELKESSTLMESLYEKLSKGMPAPRKGLKNTIMSKITGEFKDRADADSYLLRASEVEWAKTNIPGIDFKILYKDENERTMFIARLAPGASLPSHRRLSTEECLVLSGDFWADGEKLVAGDFIAGREGNEPEAVYTEGGCELLLKMRIPEEITMN
ncbi:MAG: cupin domain-containing protein [bacterium]